MDTKTRLQDVFRDVFDDEEIVISGEMTADDIEDWDSLTQVQLLVAVQDEFGVKFSISETTGLKNVGELLALIEKKL